MDLEHVLLTLDSATDNGWSGDLHAVTGLTNGGEMSHLSTGEL